ncbi:6-phosphogluconolactonase [Bosea sp. BK604]|uniref:6-phosphogluconolactonase n=1 Tax=Bosea sp. BK604 TaxID=2512180 RepID=UPI0010CE37BF|nr:6-phosphogluconolactonase [Bosea sp. BK604]TCR65645.1 6-phosphogluconolactonase [Bosea sp. BK604]
MAETIVHSDPDAVAAAMAGIIAGLSQDAGRERIAIALSGGSTPQRLYRLLASDAYRDSVRWQRLHLFWGDERVVPHDHPDSNTRMVSEALLQHVAIPPENVHLVPTQAGDCERVASLYDEEIRRFYGGSGPEPGRPLFDLVLLGLGGDGHTASLFPASPALADRAHWVAPVPEAGMKPFVPRVTLTFGAIASSREIAFLVTGEDKRDRLGDIRAGRDLPAGQVRSDGRITWHIDTAAAGS